MENHFKACYLFIVIVIYITQPKYRATVFTYKVLLHNHYQVTVSITQTREVNKMAPWALTTKVTSSRPTDITDTSIENVNNADII